MFPCLFDKYFHFFSYNGFGEEDSPDYKYHYVSGPDTFVGPERNQMVYYRLSLFRFDIRKKIKNNLYLSLIYNIAPNYDGDFYPINKDAFQGGGVGLTYDTALGPIQFIYARGDKINVLNPSKKSDVYYLTMGFKIK